MSLITDSMVKLIDDALGGEPLTFCKECGTALTYTNVAYWVDFELCRTCVNDPIGANAPEAVNILLAGGYLVVARMHGRWSLRLELKTANKQKMITLKTGLGGRMYRNERHSTVWKWAACSKRDIHAVGRVIFPTRTTLGRTLITYANMKQDDMTMFAQGIAEIFQKRSIPLEEITD